MTIDGINPTANQSLESSEVSNHSAELEQLLKSEADSSETMPSGGLPGGSEGLWTKPTESKIEVKSGGNTMEGVSDSPQIVTGQTELESRDQAEGLISAPSASMGDSAFTSIEQTKEEPLPDPETVKIPDTVPEEMVKEVRDNGASEIERYVDPIEKADPEFDRRTAEIQRDWEGKNPIAEQSQTEDPEQRFEAKKESAAELFKEMIKDLDDMSAEYSRELESVQREFEKKIEEADRLAAEAEQKRVEAYTIRTDAENSKDKERAIIEAKIAAVDEKRKQIEGLKV
ncbi:MAG: hypothetical protein PHT36_00335 [Patescibacteria group bacterium]|nr:hypothetical protein [Patescibacteria group bacterium]